MNHLHSAKYFTSFDGIFFYKIDHQFCEQKFFIKMSWMMTKKPVLILVGDRAERLMINFSTLKSSLTTDIDISRSIKSQFLNCLFNIFCLISHEVSLNVVLASV